MSRPLSSELTADERAAFARDGWLVLKGAVGAAEEHDRLRKQLAGAHAYASDSLSSLLLDAFLLIADEKGYITYSDFKRALLLEKALKTPEIDLLWSR